MTRSTAILSRRRGLVHAGRGRIVLVAAAALSSLTGVGEASHPWAPVRNTAPQQAAGRVTENRPIYYPRRAHIKPDAQTATATDRLLREFVDLHTAMSYEEAAAVADRLVQVMPRRPQAHYNRACVMGRLYRGDEALTSLEQAVDCGWRDLVHLSVDPDLDSIRETARYAELTRRLRHLIAAESGALTPARPSADVIRREAPLILREFGVPAASITLVNEGHVSWMTSITQGSAVPPIPAGDDPVEVSSVVRLFALMAMLQQPASDAGVPSAAGQGRGPVLRQTSHGPGPPQVQDEAALIEAVETATGRPFVSYCRTHVLGPLRMADTRFAGPPGAHGPVVYSTAGDLGRLLAALCPPATDEAAAPPNEASIGRLIAVGRRLGLDARVEPGSAAAVLELVHRAEQSATVLRWAPRRGQGVVIVTVGGDGIPAARRIAGLALGR